MNLTIHTGELTKSHDTDAGFDIHSTADIVLLPGSFDTIPTNLTLTLPEDSIGLVKPRSGSSFKSSIETGAGVIDQDYEGEIKVKLYNNGVDPFFINKGDRIAQIVFFYRPSIIVTTCEGAIYNSPIGLQRGIKGFGSSGK